MANEKHHGYSTKGVEPRARAEQTLTEKETLVSAAAAFVDFSQVDSLGDHGDSFQALSMSVRFDPALGQSTHQPPDVAGVHSVRGASVQGGAQSSFSPAADKTAQFSPSAQPPAHHNHSIPCRRSAPQRNTALSLSHARGRFEVSALQFI